MNYISTNLFEKELLFEGTVILKYHIEYPSIYGSIYEPNVFKFNYYNKNLALTLKNKSETELYREAIETYKYNKENGFPVMVYEVYRNFDVTFNTSNIISLYFDEYTFTGGAHGNTTRTSQTWNLLQGFMLPLNFFFPNNLYFIINILKKINEEIAKEPEIYFENTCNLVLDTFNPRSYYLSPKRYCRILSAIWHSTILFWNSNL